MTVHPRVGVALVSVMTPVPARGQKPMKALKPRVPPLWKSTSPNRKRRWFHTRHTLCLPLAATRGGKRAHLPWRYRSAPAVPHGAGRTRYRESLRHVQRTADAIHDQIPIIPTGGVGQQLPEQAHAEVGIQHPRAGHSPRPEPRGGPVEVIEAVVGVRVGGPAAQRRQIEVRRKAREPAGVGG